MPESTISERLIFQGNTYPPMPKRSVSHTLDNENVTKLDLRVEESFVSTLGKRIEVSCYSLTLIARATKL